MPLSEMQVIERIVTDYFDGLHQADVAKLRRIFHPDVVLKAPGLRRTMNEWLSAVASRPVPQEEGAAYRFKILSIEVIGEQAMVKVECPLFDYFYIDYLGLLREEGEWLIVSKMYCDMAAEAEKDLAQTEA